ncbi:hypothetical protein J2X47_003693 [Sphingomonas sp. BE270]|jgi:hypothetical protein|uniref:Uncharacterized protein n=1 Tax=hydrothermal vent metagenome TaxID=652676 RepID=A0A160THB5_9ZZZZ|nr:MULTISPECIES: hypothetical protein [unclassified Sphingomonas]MDR7259489.1 hypothetical protein [Sphingomonas sp. BE270]
MLIELHKLRIIKALSEETPCYTAEIWIDGALAFHASNRGHGGADDYRQVSAITEAEVNSWLRVNRPTRSFHGMSFEPDLEHEIARLMDEVEHLGLLRRRKRTNVITIEDGEVYTYPLKGRPAATLIAAIRAKKPDIEIVNETGEAGLARAVRVLLAKASDHQEG